MVCFEMILGYRSHDDKLVSWLAPSDKAITLNFIMPTEFLNYKSVGDQFPKNPREGKEANGQWHETRFDSNRESNMPTYSQLSDIFQENNGN